MSTDQTPETTALAVPSTPVDTNSLAALADIIGGSTTPFYTSLDVKNPAHQDLLFAVSEAATHKVEDLIGTTINLAHIYLSKANKTDLATGEIVDLTRVVLIDDKGVSYGCFSDGVAESVRKLIGVYGLPPWRTPIRVTLEKQRTAAGRIRFFLTKALPAAVQPQRGAK